ncbi:hypothetical protein KTG70_03445 [Acinetobacter variabilis]|uniref:hypothetical protein n=1 Tax=Acinetobacter TaxID=469 RepID=UPI0013306C37|nr:MULTISPECIES: hypothetical protein [Acinetobacter]MCU4364254.1 hypothetical protein [Acinetobacter variabilis]MCU4374411.1 hypothetical protein [Acinetobacter variabilis]MDM1324959.1 hypothetical protein [Acinetobacter pseudolwoffii]NHB64849.1 hypothetical protein [Acinetobacter sp. GFQ9D191M]NHB99741.1 hypothetical protein [Acinetobacter sp. GFQ9D192M]
MNKMTQAVLAALALSFGFGSTVVYAADAETAGRPGHNPKPPIDWSKCNTLGCEKEIPISLKINKKCILTGGNAILLSAAGGTQSTNYSITTNTPYVLNLQTANAGASNNTFVRHETDASETISTTIVTTKQGAGAVPFGNSNHNGQAVDNYTLAVTNAAVDATQLAGNYTDRYLIKAYY